MSAHLPRVAITGIGVVSPYGVGRERFWQHVRRRCSATRAIADFDAAPYGCMVAAPVPAVSIDDMSPVEARSDGAGFGLLLRRRIAVEERTLGMRRGL